MGSHRLARNPWFCQYNPCAVMTTVYCHVMTRDRVVQFRVNAEERAVMDRLAAAAGMRLSDWVRSRALEEALSTGTVAGEDAHVSPGRLAASPRASFDHGHVCPVPGCSWSAPSPNAVCPSHQRKIR